MSSFQLFYVVAWFVCETLVLYNLCFLNIIKSSWEPLMSLQYCNFFSFFFFSLLVHCNLRYIWCLIVCANRNGFLLRKSLSSWNVQEKVWPQRRERRGSKCLAQISLRRKRRASFSSSWALCGILSHGSWNLLLSWPLFWLMEGY